VAGVLAVLTVATALHLPVDESSSAAAEIVGEDLSAGSASPVDPGTHLVSYPLADRRAAPSDIVEGSEGSVWVALFNAKAMIQMGYDGRVLQTIHLSAGPSRLAPDGEGGVWAAEYAGDRIAHVSQSGELHEYAVPTGSFPDHPIDAGDSTYFTLSGANDYGRIDEATGAVATFAIPGASSPTDIAVSGDEIWLPDPAADTLWRRDRSGRDLAPIAEGHDLERLWLSPPDPNSIGGFGATATEVRSITNSSFGTTTRVVAEGLGAVAGFDFLPLRGELWFADSTDGTVEVLDDEPHVRFKVAQENDLSGLVITGDRYAWTVGRTSGTVFRLDILATIDVSRVAGTDRYETAVKLTQADYPTGSSTVLVASGERFPDALSAGAVAAGQKAPLLLTARDFLPDVVGAELAALRPSRVVVVGGPAAVSDRVVAALRAASGGAAVTRIGGADRFAVSRAVVTGEFSPAKRTSLFIATGRTFPDALAAVPLAAKEGGSVLLVDGTKDQLTEEEMAIVALYPRSTAQVSIVGGTNAVSSAIQRQVEAVADVRRFDGADRFEVAVAIGRELKFFWRSVNIASGEDFADALAGGAVAGVASRPILLSRSTCVPSSVLEAMAENHTVKVRLIGGPRALNESVADFTTC
jgi:putative cell wall-binding protein